MKLSESRISLVVWCACFTVHVFWRDAFCVGGFLCWPDY